MELRLFRKFHSNCTIGILSIDGEYFCYTLEDTVRKKGVKIDGETAIPEGKYDIKLKKSPKTGLLTPWLQDVPNFTNVQIHIGNFVDDTDGCILVAFVMGENAIFRSRPCFYALMDKLVAAKERKEKITITIL